jgi:hypothetical protein
MKIDSIGMSATAATKRTEEIVKEINETASSERSNGDDNRIFSVVDMWNLRKMQRTSLERRRFLN